MRLSHAALRAQTARGHGTLLNVASVAAFLPRGSYGAAKTWLTSFGRWAALEYAGRGVTVTTVCPGYVHTEFHQRLGSRPGRGVLWMEPDAVVRRALADVDRGRAISVPGAHYRVIVAVAQLVPSRVLQRFLRMLRR
jgi:short-subunit dehydrogenase